MGFFDSNANTQRDEDNAFNAYVARELKYWMEHPFDIADNNPLSRFGAENRGKAIEGGISQRGDYQAALEQRKKYRAMATDDLNASWTATRVLNAGTAQSNPEMQTKQQDFLNAYRAQFTLPKLDKPVTGDESRDYLGF